MNKNKMLQSFVALTIGLLASSTSALAIVEVKSNASTTSVITTKTASSTIDATVSASTSLNSNGSTTNYQSSDALMMQTGVNADGNESITLPSNINSAADLQAYQATLMSKDGSISEINTDGEDEVTVTWNQKGKLFAIFPVTVTTKTTVKVKSDNTTKVEASMPWWTVFVTDIADVTEETEATLIASNEVKTYANATTNAEAKAQVVYAIVSEIKANAEANLNVDMKANLDSNIN